MDSIWFDVADTEPSSSQSEKEPFLGIFNDEPANISASLSRPKTPFQNTSDINLIKQFDAFMIYNKNSDLNCAPIADFAESPSRNISMGMEGKNKKMFELYVYS